MLCRLTDDMGAGWPEEEQNWGKTGTTVAA